MWHRPPTTVRQIPLSWAILSSCFQVWPIFYYHLQGLCAKCSLVGLFSTCLWGFHVKACLVVLEASFPRVCPIHPHRFLLILSPAGSWCVLCHRSVFLMVSGQRMLRILLRQLLMKVCTFLMAVFLSPCVYSIKRRDFRLELNSLRRN